MTIIDQHKLDRVTQELAQREPIFHRPEYGTSRRDFDQMMDDNFWEIGASGKIYSRSAVLDVLEKCHASPVTEQFKVTDFGCRCISENTFLVTYQLEQDGGRLSRRSTLWQFSGNRWKILYHQGTLITSTHHVSVPT